VALPIQPLCDHGWDGPCPIALARGIAQKAGLTPPLAACLADLLHEPIGDAEA
jgi:hypothetical protein